MLRDILIFLYSKIVVLDLIPNNTSRRTGNEQIVTGRNVFQDYIVVLYVYEILFLYFLKVYKYLRLIKGFGRDTDFICKVSNVHSKISFVIYVMNWSKHISNIQMVYNNYFFTVSLPEFNLSYIAYCWQKCIYLYLKGFQT